MKRKTKRNKPRKAQSRALAVVLPFPVPQNLVQVCANALKDPRADVTKMREVVALIERLDNRAAEERFAVALASAQAKMPRVVKDKPNSSTNSRFASLEKISRVVDPIAYEHGFSMSFSHAECPIPDHYRVTAQLSLGMHTRNFMIDVPCDMLGPKGNPNKTRTHGMASADSYGVRIMKTRMFNIAVVDQDDDGQAAGGAQTIATDEDQFKRLDAKIDAYRADRPAFLKYYQIEKIEDLPRTKFDEAMRLLDQKYGKKAS